MHALSQMVYVASTIPVHKVLGCSLSMQQFPSDVLGPEETANMGTCLAEPCEVPEEESVFSSLQRQFSMMHTQDQERYMNMLVRRRKRIRDAGNPTGNAKQNEIPLP